MDLAAASCPTPISRYADIVMAHGGGGRLMRDLIEAVFFSTLGGGAQIPAHDAATLGVPTQRIALTTDSFVVRPLFFPGSDIGELAVFGTVNDLAMAGARPLYLSASFILEEGLPISTLQRVVASMASAAARAGVSVVTGDTKVVERGRCEGMYITTAGVGAVEHGLAVGPASVRPGDAVILSGDLGRHGIAVMAVREGFQFDTDIASDCAPLWGPVSALLGSGVQVRCLRDLTRGGLASALVEIADGAKVEIMIEEDAAPVSEPVRVACEILGYDPLHVANEGRFVAFVPYPDAERALAAMRSHPVASEAVIIGRVSSAERGEVVMRTMGGLRPVDMLSGEQLPRIC